MPSTTTETVVVPADAVIEAAATLFAVETLENAIRDDGQGPGQLEPIFLKAGDDLLDAAFNETKDEDLPGWVFSAVSARSDEIAADWIEALVNKPVSLGNLLGFGGDLPARELTTERLRERAKSTRAEA